MTAPRLELALDGGGLDLPDAGRIVLFGPTSGMTFSGLPKERCLVVTGNRVDHDAFAAAGFDVAPRAEGRAALSIVFLPRAKLLARSRIAAAAAMTDGPVVVDGQRTDGIDSILKALRARTDVLGPVNKAHGKLFWFSGADLSDWQAGAPAVLPGGWHTVPGVFSADGVDPASALLAAALPDKMTGRVADLGCGWGYLSRGILGRAGVATLDMVEVDHDALDCARLNVVDPRARFHWADATRWRAESPLDHVVTNPPFHTSRAADPGLGQAFVRSAAANLRPGGQVWLVANRHLPYEAQLRDAFGAVEEIGGDARFKILTARHAPRKGGRNRLS